MCIYSLSVGEGSDVLAGGGERDPLTAKEWWVLAWLSLLRNVPGPTLWPELYGFFLLPSAMLGSIPHSLILELPSLPFLPSLPLPLQCPVHTH